MKRFISVFLCLILCFSIVIPVSASASDNVGIDSSTDGYFIDVTPYLEKNYFNTSSVAAGGSVDINLVFDRNVEIYSVDFIIETNDTNPSFTYDTGSLVRTYNVVRLGDTSNFYRVYGFVASSVLSSYTFNYIKSSGSFLRIKNFNISPGKISYFGLPITANITGSYTYRNYNNDGSFTTSSASIDEELTFDSFGYNLFIPKLHAHTGTILDNTPEINKQSVFLDCYLTFDWKAYDKVDLYFENYFDSISDYSFYVSSINVLSDIQTVDLESGKATIVTLDFSNLDRATLHDKCYIHITGYKELSSAGSSSLFKFYNCVGSVKMASTNFWPSWLQKIIDKLDAMIIGRGEDQSAADSFQDTVDEQASQFEDMSNTMNQVERPDIESIDLSTNNMVDTDSVILATNGIGNILENPIILRVILMALTLALAGFVLYGKR